LDELATQELHGIQTSGNCIRNVTADHFSGAAEDEIEDPRILSEIIRQWSTFHPEFSYLPRKFKIAVSGSPKDRAAIQWHDIGVQVVRNNAGEVGYQVHVGGGMGRTPMIGPAIGAFVPKRDILAYLEAVMRVYNQYGRRDNIYKARIKILVHQIGVEEMRRQVEAEFAEIKAHGELDLPAEEMARIASYFAAPRFAALPAHSNELDTAKARSAEFATWVAQNVVSHISQSARLRDRDDLVEADWRHSGRRDFRTDGSGRGAGPEILVRRDARQP
jgi:sulfite reductase (NADPH) hemoprotein beta-component